MCLYVHKGVGASLDVLSRFKYWWEGGEYDCGGSFWNIKMSIVGLKCKQRQEDWLQLDVMVTARENTRQLSDGDRKGDTYAATLM